MGSRIAKDRVNQEDRRLSLSLSLSKYLLSARFLDFLLRVDSREGRGEAVGRLEHVQLRGRLQIHIRLLLGSGWKKWKHDLDIRRGIIECVSLAYSLYNSLISERSKALFLRSLQYIS